LAQLYEDAKMHGDAKKFISHAVLHPPADQLTQLATYLAAARWALDTNQANEAFDYASRAYNLDPKGKRALDAKFLMGVAARMKGDTKTAEQDLNDVYMARPGDFQASNQLAQVLGEQKSDPDKQERGLQIASTNYAAASSQEVARREPARAIEAAATLGWVFYQMDRIPEADQVTQAIINAGVASPDILYYRARLFQEHGQTKEAVASLQASLKNARGFFVHREDAEQWLAKLDKSHTSSSSTSSSKPAETTPLDKGSSDNTNKTDTGAEKDKGKASK
jgi:tetratricopeptide (TPR) repeat protein